MIRSIWADGQEFQTLGTLRTCKTADVAVIGAGMTGLLTAYFLQRAGLRVIVLEAAAPAEGQTLGTTAKITWQHGAIYHRLCRQFGTSFARDYYRANQAAAERFRSIIETERIDCDYTPAPSILYATQNVADLLAEWNAAKNLRIPCEMLAHTELPFEVQGALCFEGTACFHPIRFLKAIAKELDVYTFSPVVQTREGKAITAHGSVKARAVVVATHYPFRNFPGFYFARMHQSRSYVLALEDAPPLRGMYYGIDADGHSFRPIAGGLLLGGEGHRTGEQNIGDRYQRLERYAKGLYPNARVVAQWSAQDCMTCDGVPFVGRYSNTTPWLYVATGYNKWGMTGSMNAAMLLCDQILLRKNEFAGVFATGRFRLRASGKRLLHDGGVTIRQLMKTAFARPGGAKLETGRGAMVTVGGRTFGAYREPGGRIYLVNLRCPHLGCRLEWNQTERTWDCPCHGSRFSYQGKLLANPAQQDLQQVCVRKKIPPRS